MPSACFNKMMQYSVPVSNVSSSDYVTLTDWLIIWLPHWLTDLSTDYLTDWLTIWLARLTDLSTIWLTDWLTICLTRLSDLSTDYLTVLQYVARCRTQWAKNPQQLHAVNSCGVFLDSTREWKSRERQAQQCLHFFPRFSKSCKGRVDLRAKDISSKIAAEVIFKLSS